MRPASLALAFLIWPAAVNAEDLSKFTGGLLMSSDCDAEICRSYTIEVSKKFIRLPIKRQLSIVGKFCAAIDETAEDYEDGDGKPFRVGLCVFQYNGRDIIYRTTGAHAAAEGWYVAALAALRD